MNSSLHTLNSTEIQDVPALFGSLVLLSDPAELLMTGLQPKYNQGKARSCGFHQWDFKQEVFMSTKTHSA